MSADLASLAEKRLEAPSGFEPLHKGFADQSTIVILLIRLALCFSWVADFAPYLDLIVPKLFPNKPEHKGLKNLRAQASPLEGLGCMPHSLSSLFGTVRRLRVPPGQCGIDFAQDTGCRACR